MSGICGIFNLDGEPVDRALLEKMTASLNFRGPDARGVWADGAVGFGHTLLRTTDESANESQPYSLDREVYITADARIDGREELLEKLQDKSLPQNIPDVNLVLHAYRRWGEDCLQHLLGDFAFAIWDRRKQKLFCARDPVGAKLFYYARAGNSLIFSNTLDCLHLHPQISSRLNEQAIGDFLLFGINCESETTMFADLQCLPGAYQLIASAGQIRHKTYWALSVPPQIRYRNPDDYVSHFRTVMDKAVGDRLRTKNISIFLSGGLDSTNIAVAALEAAKKRGRAIDLRAFTVVYDRLIPDEERHFAGLAARTLDIPIHYTVADDYQPYQGWEELHSPEPFSSPLIQSDLDKMRAIAAHSRVALYGQGGDEALRIATVTEMLKGMPLPHVAIDLARCLWQYRLKPNWGTGILAAARRVSTNKTSFPSWLNPEFCRRQALEERWQKIWNQPLPLDRPPRSFSYHGLPPNAIWHLSFAVRDPGFSQFPVEVRTPFLDLRLLNYLLALPPLPWCVGKELLRATLRDKLPESIVRRPKSPLAGSPLGILLAAERAAGTKRALSETVAPYIDRGAWQKALQSGEGEASRRLRPFSLDYWVQSRG